MTDRALDTHTRSIVPLGVRLLALHDRPDHSFIEPSDECWFITEYRPGNRGAYGINRLVFDWKSSVSAAALNPAVSRSKESAIRTVASLLRRCCDRQWAENITWCPIPTSSALGSPDYDDRLWRTVRAAFEGYDLDVRLLLRQVVTTTADHMAVRRSTSRQLYDALQVDVGALQERPLRQRIVLFDDLLTSGKHFKCCQRRLREAAPWIAVSGLFFARRVQVSRWCNNAIGRDGDSSTAPKKMRRLR